MGVGGNVDCSVACTIQRRQRMYLGTLDGDKTQLGAYGDLELSFIVIDCDKA